MGDAIRYAINIHSSRFFMDVKILKVDPTTGPLTGESSSLEELGF